MLWDDADGEVEVEVEMILVVGELSPVWSESLSSKSSCCLFLFPCCLLLSSSDTPNFTKCLKLASNCLIFSSSCGPDLTEQSRISTSSLLIFRYGHLFSWNCLHNLRETRKQQQLQPIQVRLEPMLTKKPKSRTFSTWSRSRPMRWLHPSWACKIRS